MNITSARYKSSEGRNVSITAVINGDTVSVPLDPNNMDYAPSLSGRNKTATRFKQRSNVTCH